MQNKITGYRSVSQTRPVQRFFCICAALFGFFASYTASALPLNELQQVTENFPKFADVNSDEVKLTPDGKTIVFTVDINSSGLVELFSMPISGGEITQLNPNLLSGRDVIDFEITPDGQYVVYRADLEADNVLELFRVPVAGGASERLNPSFQEPLLLNRDVGALFQISPDGAFVIYQADLSIDGRDEVLRVPIEGGASERLSPPVVEGGGVVDILISPDGSTVVYVADQEIDDVFELFGVPINGSEEDVTRLHPPLTGAQDASSPAFSPDGKRVVFELNRDHPFNDELFSAAANGDNSAAFVALIPDFPTQTGNASSFQISADSQRVVYTADQRIDGVRELFVASIEGGVPSVRISAELPSTGDVYEFKIGPNGRRVFYTADAFINGADKLFSVPIDGDGSVATPIESDTLSEDGVIRFEFSGDGRHVIIERLIDIDETIQLIRAPIDGGGPSSLFSSRFGDPDDDGESVVFETFNGGQFLLFVPPDARRIFVARLVELASLDISAADTRIVEGNNGLSVFSFTVSRSSSVGASSVNYSLAGSGASPANVADFGGILPSGSLSFLNGERVKTVNVLISGDIAIEPNEAFTVSLSNVLNATIATPTITATIVNDDVDTDQDGLVDSIDPDIDGDGMPNRFEQENGLNPRDASDANQDNDGDGFTNLQEFEFGSDPNEADVDENNNGIPDAAEAPKFNVAPILLLLLDDDEV